MDVGCVGDEFEGGDAKIHALRRLWWLVELRGGKVLSAGLELGLVEVLFDFTAKSAGVDYGSFNGAEEAVG